MHFTWIPIFAAASLAFTLSSAAAVPVGEEIVVKKRTPPTCLHSNCPKVTRGTAVCAGPGFGTCSFICEDGYEAHGKFCRLAKECRKSTCPKTAHSEPFCTSKGDCDFTCDPPYKKNGRCVKACDKFKCPEVSNSVSWCSTSGDCNHTCSDGKCEKK
ncbi:hypothetical protein MVLG_03737 [Microbotryum lychnidis-dioicae p1A1 Lamole]|uniref:TNFR-Cys domain-containing protein n=1 Tax=Microbotryum lychnidis-dioicae (strain p1A1 Lamole / MvSl-1064) TaxID=683840 RepID=U5H942_USTV1|nr:hypothetical protein MVLG_03737 [Microbotryum lychnidis-dioicae p1A1 Lamole]|eukprot:KDE05924.1 hypothetical protein MVLG_03737 [Microbotryum lychnidis-dioicae p1A1 Lamole]